MNDASWWLGPAVTILGILAAQMVVVWLFFARQKAEDDRRWHQKRLELYIDFTRGVLDYTNDPSATDGETWLLRDWVHRCSAQISLVASKPVHDAAQSLLSATLDVIEASTSGSRGAELPPGSYPQSLHEKRLAFEAAARNELGIARPE
jgi:hypothetical protein